MMPVNTVPTSTPTRGFLNTISKLANSGTSARGLTALLMRFIPNMRTENPTKMLPTSFRRVLLDAIIRVTPTMAKMGEKFSGLSSRSQKTSL